MIIQLPFFYSISNHFKEEFHLIISFFNFHNDVKGLLCASKCVKESEGASYVASSSLCRVIRSMQKITQRHISQQTCRNTHTHTRTHTRTHTPLSWPYVAEAKPIASIARKHDMTFQIH